MNIIALTGNLTKDIDLQYTPNGTAVAKGTIAVRRDFKDKQTGEYGTDFINFTQFGKGAEIMAQYVKKGDKFGLNGRLQVDVYDGSDGQRKYFTHVIVNGFDLPSKQQSANQQTNSTQQTSHFSGAGQQVDILDEDMPF